MVALQSIMRVFAVNSVGDVGLHCALLGCAFKYLLCLELLLFSIIKDLLE